MNFGAGQAAGLRSRTNGNRLDRRYGHDRLGQTPIEFQIPGRVRAKTGDYSLSNNFENTAERVDCFAFLVY